MRLKSCLENWGILPGFLVVCGRDVQRDPQRRAQVFATALNMYLCPHLSLINLIAQIKRQLEWCVLAKKAGEEGKPIAAQIHLAASGGFQKSMHPLLKSQEMQAFSCHGRYLQMASAAISLATRSGQLSPCTSCVLLLCWDGPSQGWAEPGLSALILTF